MGNVYGARPFELDFICEPFAYKDADTVDIESGFNEMQYSGTESCPTLIIIKNVGEATVNNIEVVAMLRKDL